MSLSRDATTGLNGARPLILPDKFTGDGDFGEWITHFDNVSVINGWNDVEKYNWLNLHVTGKARVTLTRLQQKPEKPTYEQVIDKLRMRFEPPAKRQLYKTRLTSRVKHDEESWDDYGDELVLLADKAYPELQEEARDMLALNKYLEELREEKISLAVRQQRPRTVAEAVQATIELETFLQPVHQPKVKTPPRYEKDLSTVDTPALMDAIQELTNRVENLEGLVVSKHSISTRYHQSGHHRPVVCRRYGCSGHYARGCASKQRNPGTANTASSSSGQEVTSQMDREAEEGIEKVNEQTQDVSTITVNSVSNYSINVTIGGTKLSFLVDTGAAVSLIDGQMWDNIQQLKDTVKLNPVTTRLVGVDGVPLQVRGSAVITLSIMGLTVDQTLIVADSLTSQGILGMDFLESHHCILDLAEGKLSTGGRHIPLNPRTASNNVTQVEVTVEETFSIAAFSEMEIMGNVNNDCEGTWVVEDRLSKKPPVLVARGLVTPDQGRLPMRVLNVGTEPVTIYKGTRIATAESMDSDWEAVCTFTDNALSQQSDNSVVQELIESIPTDLNDVQHRQMTALLIQYAHIFANNSTDLGRTKLLTHHIETTGAPVRQGVRRVPLPQRESVRKLIEEMKEKGIISPSNSPWASPIVLVPKKDGSIRLCVDYRKVNEITRKDAYPIPRVDDTLDTLAGAKWFSTLDLKSGYWQVEVCKDDREKTAFCTHEGLFQFNVMPFGLCNAPATFQRLMDMVLRGLLWDSCLVYIDDIIIVGDTFEQHLDNLSKVFERIKQAGLKLQPHKCHLLQPQVHFLGHIVSTDGVSPDPEKSEKVKNWPKPTSVKEVQQFLGLASYYRRFIKNFASVAAPLHKLTEKHSVFHWTPQCQEAFDHLKSRLVSAPVLALPDWSKPFVLDTDASDTGIGAVLSQLHGTDEHVIAYGSRMLSKAEKNYCVTKKELLAVVVFLEQFRPYLLGKPFTIRTDHNALTWLQRFKEPEGQMARWLQRLQEYQFDILHRPGKKHSNADALSRVPCRQCGFLSNEADTCINSVDVSDLSLSASSAADLRAAQLADAVIKPILQSKEANHRPNISSADSLPYRRLAQVWDQLIVKDGVLYRWFAGPDDSSNHLQLVVPLDLRSEVLESLHGGIVGGHLGHEKTFSRIQGRFYWPGYWSDTRDWCLTCHECSTRKTSTHPRRAPLGTIQAGYPTQIMAVDLLGPLPESPQKNCYVMVVGDYFSRWMEAIPLPNQEASTVADHLVDEVFMRFSVPEQLHSDQGPQFESQLVKEVCKLLHIKKTRTTPYHPQCDGMVERFNRTLLNMLATHCKDHPWDWEQHICKVCMAYNTSVNSTTDYTPFYLMFGRQARLPVDVMYGGTITDSQSPSEYAVSLKKQLTAAFDTVRQTCKTQHERQKEQYNKRIHGDPHSVGDWVWVLNPKVPKNNTKKLFHPWKGPCKVVKRISECTYRIQYLTGRRQRQVVHFNRLKPCPKNVRLRDSVDSEPGNTSDNPSTQEELSTSKPFGTDLELIDGDDDTTPPTSQQQHSPEVLTEQSNRRYPLRQRHPPVRFNDYVLSSVRDVHSEEGGSVRVEQP